LVIDAGLIRLLAVLTGISLLPGCALLSLAGGWHQWKGLQRWIVATGVSIAFYPVLFYLLRSLLPSLTLGPYQMAGLLIGFAILISWRLRRHWRQWFSLDRSEWIAVAIFGMTLFTRFWIIRDHPYPAWSDSLHHSLLTELTSVLGQLPTSLEPYFPVPLDQYHLGLYSMTATVAWLAKLPAHSALLWTAVGAIIGAAVVGLLCHQPAFYVNWGRFPQVASQAIMLIAWVVTWDTIALFTQDWQGHQTRYGIQILMAAVLNAAVFLLHFRVAAFYIPLLVVSVVWEVAKAHQGRKGGRVLAGIVAVGIASLVGILPAFWHAISVYAARTAESGAAAAQVSETARLYYEFSWDSVPVLAIRPWLLVLVGLSIAVGLARRDKFVLACLLWVAALYLLGNAYRLGIPALNITNMGAILIMLYLPAGLIIGAAAEDVLALVGASQRDKAAQLLVVLVLAVSFVASHARVADIEPFRYFVTPQDVAAMKWIQENTPPDALFAVNTFFWLPWAPHGTDGGYWIPYFTGRQTTAGVMLDTLAEEDDRTNLVKLSRKVEELEVDNEPIGALAQMGVDYIYIGQTGDFSGPGLDGARLAQSAGARIVYQDADVFILELTPPTATD
jgi:hypothetical protein